MAILKLHYSRNKYVDGLLDLLTREKSMFRG